MAKFFLVLGSWFPFHKEKALLLLVTQKMPYNFRKAISVQEENGNDKVQLGLVF